MSEHKQGPDDREKNPKDRWRASSGDESQTPPSLPSDFRTAFPDPNAKPRAVSALKQILASSSTVEQWLSMLEESWTKHDSQKAQLVDLKNQIDVLRDGIVALQRKFEFGRQQIRESEIHGELARSEAARDVMECSKAIVILAQDLELGFPSQSIKPLLRRHVKSDKAFEKYLDRALGELEEHIEALWSKIRVMVYGDQARASSERVIPLARVRQMGCEDTLTQLEALSHRVVYYVDTLEEVSKRRDALKRYREEQIKIRDDIQSKQSQCTALEDERRQLCLESDGTLALQHNAIQKIKEQLGTLCEDLSAVVVAVKDSPSRFARESEEWALVAERIKTDVTTKFSSVEVGTFLAFATEAINEVRAIIACIDLVEDLRVFGRCQNPIVSQSGSSLRRGPHRRVPGASSDSAESEVAQQQDHPDFASKLWQEREFGFIRQDSLRTRWMIEKDLEGTLLIEQQAFEKPWDRTILLNHLRQRSNVGIVAEVEGEIAGFCIYQIVRDEGTKVLKIAVAPDHRRRGIGFFMLDSLFQKKWLGEHVEVRVAEDNLGSQQFLRACGFRAVPHRDAHEGEGDYRSILFRADLAEIGEITGR